MVVENARRAVAVKALWALMNERKTDMVCALWIPREAVVDTRRRRDGRTRKKKRRKERPGVGKTARRRLMARMRGGKKVRRKRKKKAPGTAKYVRWSAGVTACGIDLENNKQGSLAPHGCPKMEKGNMHLSSLYCRCQYAP